MQAQAIHVGATLKLKRQRAEAYGFEHPHYVTVSAITRRPGYITPYIRNAQGEAFRPSDFAS